MPDIRLYNSLERQKTLFRPINKDHVTMYVCGPTVYDRAHIGNARAIVVFDVLARLLKHAYPQVTYVRNITDVDDKINKAAREQSVSIETITQKTIAHFHEDMQALHCLPPDIEPKATEHIKEMIDMIQRLIELNHAYEAEGHVLFSVSSNENYGKLSGRSRDEMIAGARVEIAPYKKDPADFVLWKPSNDQEPGWDSPWGYGRPGWHIECSAMSTQYLGKDFDIHGGGADLQFPHHENEIIQSCSAHPHSTYANYWVHNGFLTVNGEKMSKSLKNFITVNEALNMEEARQSGQTIRMLFLSTHYKKPLDWNRKALEDAAKKMDYLYQALRDSIEITNDFPPHLHNIPNELINPEIENALYDDINTPMAVTQLMAIAKEIHKTEDVALKKQLGSVLLRYGHLLGFFFTIESQPRYLSSAEWFGNDSDDTAIQSIIDTIKSARQNKDYTLADGKRQQAEAMGYVLEYKPDGNISYKLKK